MRELADLWIAWCGTYLAHSTVVLGAAWLVARWLRPGASVRDALWKCALVLPFATAGLQVALPERTIAPRIEVSSAALLDRVPLAADRAPITTFDAAWAGPMPVSIAPTPAERMRDIGNVMALLAILWSLAVLFVPEARLAWLLRSRRPVEDGPLCAEFEALVARAGLWRKVHLTVSDCIGSPIAFGVFRSEVCIPRRALTLPQPMLRALLAHEIAHHARHDPLWTRASHAVVSLGWMQPLHRIARRELSRAAEFLADDLAVEWTKDRAGLARCLAEVTGWNVAGASGAPGAVAVPMVQRRGTSPLRERVERALDGPREGKARMALAVAALCGGVVALAVPGFARAVRAADDVPARSTWAATDALQALDAELRDARDVIDALERHPEPTIRDRAQGVRERLNQLELRRRQLLDALTVRASEMQAMEPLDTLAPQIR